MRHSIMIAIGVVLLAPRPGPAQTVNAGPGSTVEGDRLRGEGVFLQGLGYWELKDAQARRIDVESMAIVAAWNRSYYEDSLRQYNEKRRKGVTRDKKQAEDRERQSAKDQFSLRTNPKPEDIQSGDALNALLTDLSEPSIAESAWRGARVALPEGISIKSLAFQFAPKAGARENAALTRGLIALGRLDMVNRHWPDVIPVGKLKPEISRYEDAYRKIVDLSIAGRLEQEAVEDLGKSIKALKAKIAVVVNVARGYRIEALKFVDGLESAASMFDASTVSYARCMIADTQQHDASTVGELLAFMRKFRLVFAAASATPDGDLAYSKLYSSLREQKDLLGLGAADALAEHFRAGAIWEGQRTIEDPADPGKIISYKLVVTESNGSRFTGKFFFDGVTRDHWKLAGSIEGNRVTYHEFGGEQYSMMIEGTGDKRKIIYRFRGKRNNGEARYGRGEMGLTGDPKAEFR